VNRRLYVAAAALAIGGARLWLRARVPDDYDSIGFVASLDDFNLSKFQPQFPGYPVYVALGRAVHAVVGSPLLSAELVSAAAGAAAAPGVFALGRRAGGEAAGWCALGVYGGAALPWLTGGAALSDATGAALAVLAFWALAESRALVGGLLCGLMLGARASYWPLALSWMIALGWWRRGEIARGLAGAMAGLALWAAPLLALVGVRQFVALGRAHLRGHFGEWGGSVVTRPQLGARVAAFARHLFVDGVAPRAWALVPLTLLLLLGARRLPWRVSLVVCAPYALWALFGQNVIDQPRHLLPLAIALAIGLGVATAQAIDVAAAGVWLAAATALLVWAASLPEALARARTEPAAAQAAEWMAANQPRAMIFGGRSMRFFRQRGLDADEHTWLSEVDVALERVDRLPKSVLVTSEVEADARRRTRLTPAATFCRTTILDATPCLTLYEYSMGRAP
jgi:hypothetical protein